MATNRDPGGFWWQSLRVDREVPASVFERLRWYERQIPPQRVGFYALDILVIGVSASIPAATSLGASAATAGLLGAAVTALVALRQLWRPRENWIRYAATRALLQAEVVAWSATADPYGSSNADSVLISRVETIVLNETSQWTQLRNSENAQSTPPS